MWKATPDRVLTAAMLLCAISALADAQTLPAASPTQAPPSPPAARTIPVQPITPAKVVFAGNLLTVTAQNSSLNQILGDISRATGMKITGGVSEERVFGSYGPASPQEVLVTLLDGCGSNILMHEDANHQVRELVLSARAGGVTPPPPPGANTEADGPIEPSERWRRLQERRDAARARIQEQQTNQAEPAAEQNNSPGQQVQPSPNGVKTPSQFGHEGNFPPPQQQLPPETPPN